jgi:hypothetical protein
MLAIEIGGLMAAGLFVLVIFALGTAISILLNQLSGGSPPTGADLDNQARVNRAWSEYRLEKFVERQVM